MDKLSPGHRFPFILLFHTFCTILNLFLCLNEAAAQNPGQPSRDDIHLQKARTSSTRAAIGDTTAFHQSYLKFAREAGRMSQIREDTFRAHGHTALSLSRTASYPAGMIRTSLLFGWGYIAKNEPDSSLYYFTFAKSEAEQMADTALLAQACVGLGWTSLYIQDYKTSLSLAAAARELARRKGDPHLMKYIFERVAKIFQYCQAPLDAYTTWYDLHQICLADADTAFMVKGYHILESIYADMHLPGRQINVVRKLMDVRPFIQDTPSIHTLYRTVSRVYLLHEKYDSALYFTRLNLPYAEKENKLPMVFTRLGRIYLELKQPDSARHYFQKALDSLSAQKEYIDTDLWLDLGHTEFLSGNFTKALSHYQRAEAEIQKPKLSVQRDIYKALYEYHKARQHPDLAFSYLEKYQWLADSISRFQNTYQAGLALLELETAERENAIQLLTKDNELKSAVNVRNRREKKMIAGAGVAGLLLMSFGFYRFKKWKDLKAREKLLNERLRISRDLHDEVGSTLSGIRMYSHLLRHQIISSNIPEATTSLDTIQASAGDMVEKLGDIVWLVHPSNDTLHKLLDKLKEYAQGVSRMNSTDLEFQVDPRLPDPALPVETRRNLFLIFKEGFHNAVKYSEAKRITFSASTRDQVLRLQLEDQGKGFDPKTATHGNGLRNMQQRAEEMAAELNISSEMGSGTCITLEIQLPQ